MQVAKLGAPGLFLGLLLIVSSSAQTSSPALRFGDPQGDVLFTHGLDVQPETIPGTGPFADAVDLDSVELMPQDADLLIVFHVRHLQAVGPSDPDAPGQVTYAVSFQDPGNDTFQATAYFNRANSNPWNWGAGWSGDWVAVPGSMDASASTVSLEVPWHVVQPGRQPFPHSYPPSYFDFALPDKNATVPVGDHWNATATPTTGNSSIEDPPGDVGNPVPSQDPTRDAVDLLRFWVTQSNATLTFHYLFKDLSPLQSPTGQAYDLAGREFYSYTETGSATLYMDYNRNPLTVTGWRFYVYETGEELVGRVDMPSNTIEVDAPLDAFLPADGAVGPFLVQATTILAYPAAATDWAPDNQQPCSCFFQLQGNASAPDPPATPGETVNETKVTPDLSPFVAGMAALVAGGLRRRRGRRENLRYSSID
jgi:hypothetical protein